MKRTASILLAFIICISIATVCTSAENVVLLGDVNGDGNVDNLDAAMILKYDAGIIELDSRAWIASDVNRDGSADNLDAAMILKYDAGLISYCYLDRHSFSTDGVCGVCGAEREGTPLGVLKDFVIKNGYYDEEAAVYSALLQEDDKQLLILNYFTEQPNDMVFSINTFDENYTYTTMLLWCESEAFSEVATIVVDNEGNTVAMAVCKILNEDFNIIDPALLDFGVLLQDMPLEEKVKEDVITILTEVDSFLKSNIYDYSMADYGFKSF